jgi:hypothetical protein
VIDVIVVYAKLFGSGALLGALGRDICARVVGGLGSGTR